MLWTDKTAGTVTETLRQMKSRMRWDYDDHIAEIVDYYGGVFSPYFESGSRALASPGPSSTPESITGGLGQAYFQRFFPNAYDYGRGALFPAYLKFLRRLVWLKASLFHRQPEYVWTVGGKPVEDGSPLHKRLGDIEAQCMLTVRLKNLDRMTRLCKTAFSVWAWRSGKLNLDIYTPDMVDVWQDENDPANIDSCFLVSHELPQPVDTPLSVKDRRFIVWERPSVGEAEVNGQSSVDWSVRVLDVNGRELRNPLFPDNRNHYGVYPYVIWHETDPTDRLLVQPDESYRTVQIGCNLLWSHYLLNAQRSGGTMVLRSQRPFMPSDLPIGMDRAIKLEDTSEDFKFEKIDFDAASMVQFAQSYLQAFASSEGIHPDAFSIDGQQFSAAITAVAKQMDRADLQEEREDSEQYWEYKMRDLIRKMVAVWNVHKPNDSLPTDLSVTVKWAVPDQPMDPLHASQSRQAEYNNGTRSPVDDIQAANPGMTREEARSKYGRNLAEMRWRRNELDGGLRQTPTEPQTTTKE